MSESHDHHYVPQFFLRNFATDPERKKVATVAKHGEVAVWGERSIESIGYERDLYVQMQNRVPVSAETAINQGIEAPISQSDTWAKTASGRADALDRSDKPILYALVRHLEARTPHYLATAKKLAQLAADPNSGMEFTDEEREMYAAYRANSGLIPAIFNAMAANLDWTEQSYRGAAVSILRSPIPLRTTTTPVLVTRAPDHPTLHLPLSGMIPYQYILTLNRTTVATVVRADFDDDFLNMEIDALVARALNRQFANQFACFENVRHLVTSKDDLVADMTWARTTLPRRPSDGSPSGGAQRVRTTHLLKHCAGGQIDTRTLRSQNAAEGDSEGLSPFCYEISEPGEPEECRIIWELAIDAKFFL